MATIDDIQFFKVIHPEKLQETQEQYPESFIHLHDEDSDSDIAEDNLYIGDCRLTDNFNIGSMDKDTATIKVGGLEASTLGELKKKSMSQIIMDMICPLTTPEKKTDPSITISYSDSKLIKVGDILPIKSDIKVTTNSGTWNNGSAYCGDCGEVTLTMTPDKWGEASEEGSYSISGKGTFAAGAMVKDSHGNDYKKGPETSVTSNTITIKSVYPIQINTEDLTVMKDYIVDYNSLQTIQVTVPAEEDDLNKKFRVYLPSVFSTFEINQFNPTSGKYDIKVDMELIEGETSKYIRTNDPLDTNTNPVQYEIKIKK